MALDKKQKNFLIFVFILTIIIVTGSCRNSSKNFFYSISSPFQARLWNYGQHISSFIQSFLHKNSLEKENQKLREENQKLLYENLFLKKLQEENEILKKTIDVGLNKEFKLQLASVVGKDLFQDTLLIDSGTKDGLVLDLPVITENKVLVGKINKVYKNFSKVELVSAKNFSFDVKIKESTIYGKAKGEGNFRVTIERLPANVNIKEGEIIVTSGEGEIFPEGLLVGKIAKIKKSDIESFQQGEIELFFKLSDLTTLFVIEK